MFFFIIHSQRKRIGVKGTHDSHIKIVNFLDKASLTSTKLS